MEKILKTKSGVIRLREAWENKFLPQSKWMRMPAVLFVDDGLGNYKAWSFSGTVRDAAKVAAPLSLRKGKVAVLTAGNSVYVIDPPSGFRMKNGRANTKRYPNIIAWGREKNVETV